MIKLLNFYLFISNDCYNLHDFIIFWQNQLYIVRWFCRKLIGVALIRIEWLINGYSFPAVLSACGRFLLWRRKKGQPQQGTTTTMKDNNNKDKGFKHGGALYRGSSHYCFFHSYLLFSMSELSSCNSNIFISSVESWFNVHLTSPTIFNYLIILLLHRLITKSALAALLFFFPLSTL